MDENEGLMQTKRTVDLAPASTASGKRCTQDAITLILKCIDITEAVGSRYVMIGFTATQAFANGRYQMGTRKI
jgi:hypothetical protein